MSGESEPTSGLSKSSPAARFEAVLDRMSEGIVVSSTSGDLVYWNRAGLLMHDYTSLDEVRRQLPEFTSVFQLSTLDGEVLPLERWPMSRVLAGEDIDGVELLARRHDREWERQLVYNGSRFVAASGELMGFVTITDVTGHRDAERELALGATKLRLAIEAARIGIYETDIASQTFTYSPEAAALLGLPAGVPIAVDEVFTRVHPADISEALAEYRRLQAAPPGSVARGEYRFLRGDGSMRTVAWATRRLLERAPDGAEHRIGALVDMSSARLTERRLATQLAVTAQLVESVPFPELMRNILHAVCDAEGFDIGTYWQLDDATRTIRCADVWHRDTPGLADLAALSRRLAYEPGTGTAGIVWATGRPLAFDDVPPLTAHPRGALAMSIGMRSVVAFPIEANGQVVGVVDFLGRSPSGTDQAMLDVFAAIGRQIGMSVERRRLEADLRRAQRIEALGVLSRGIAHDFNNVLTAIAGNVELALRDPTVGPTTRQRLESIASAQDHARDLVEQILAFAQQQPSRRSPVSLIVVADDCVEMLRAMVPASVTVRLAVDEPVPMVLADATQLHQVIINLGVNAWHALPGGAGTIEVRVAGVELAVNDEQPARKAGRYAVVSVVDDGVGMDDFTLVRIFDPFFTTKDPGAGTGLGLSVVHGIVLTHQGFIEVTSALGAGTAFHVHLPAIDGTAAPRPERAEPRSVEPRAVAPTEERDDADDRQHILFLDDEEMLAELAAQMFPELGYRATVRTDADDALEWLTGHVHEVDLVITDMNMPKRSGLEVAAAVRALRPDLPVILLSGYVAGDVAEEAVRLGIREIVSKPVSLRGLAEALRRALE